VVAWIPGRAESELWMERRYSAGDHTKRRNVRGQPSPGSNTLRHRGLSRPVPIAGSNALSLSHSGHSQRGSSIALRHRPIPHSDVSRGVRGEVRRVVYCQLPVDAPSDKPKGSS